MDLQGTPDWHAIRLGKPSASNANRMLTPTGKPSNQYLAYAHELAADVYMAESVSDFAGTIWTERGTELEPTARIEAALRLDVDVELCGAIVSDDGSYCASPDGLIGDDGVLEIKCQKHTGHIDSLMHVHRTGQPPPAYVGQMRMQMLVTGRSYAQFVAYHPDLPMATARLERDEEAEATLLKQIDLTLAERDATLEVLFALGNRTLPRAD